MKKIIVITTLLMGTTLIYAQEKGVLKGKGIQPVRTEDPHNPLVNGIPYNQYKAQVQAEEKNRAAAEAKAIAEQKTAGKNKPSNLQIHEEDQLKINPRNNH